jgi:preprotein translocase subunit SecG
MLLYYGIATLHIIVCIILVLVVLLQSGRGADLAGAFGGGATQTAFGSRGPASFLSKMTTVAAIVFMLTSFSLSMIVTPKKEAKSVLEITGGKAAPTRKAPASSGPAVPTPTPEQINKQVEEYQAKQKQQATQTPTQQPASKPADNKTPANKP